MVPFSDHCNLVGDNYLGLLASVLLSGDTFSNILWKRIYCVCRDACL